MLQFIPWKDPPLYRPAAVDTLDIFPPVRALAGRAELVFLFIVGRFIQRNRVLELAFGADLIGGFEHQPDKHDAGHKEQWPNDERYEKDREE